MVGLADENNRTYECDYGTYNQKNGFVFNEKVEDIFEDCGIEGIEAFFNKLVHEDMWKLEEEPKKMSLEDIERELGYRVRIVDPEPEKKVISDERKKELDETIEAFKRFFGLELNADDYY